MNRLVCNNCGKVSPAKHHNHDCYWCGSVEVQELV